MQPMPVFVSAFLALALSGIVRSAEEPGPDAKPNRLIDEQSPYLQQHAYNPVDWYPWGDEAFAKANAENKLVLLSVGYSTCHWCHVMNRESFSNPEIAAFLNEHFVCIKVDREERPDVDGVYMTFVQQLTGAGGWPLNVWLTPERKPFYGGTYFPPDNSRGMRTATFPELLTRIQDTWTNDPESVRQQSDQIVAALDDFNRQSSVGSESDLTIDLIANAIDAFKSSFVERTGAFGSGPNFPSAANLSFLLRSSRVKELDDERKQAAERMAVQSLEAIAQGGIRDHIGGGFHRYTVDGEWKLPHFEKMLYDQATLANAYLDAWLATGDPRFREPVVETLEYLIRDMRHPEGGYYSAEDAESLEAHGSNEKREGAFYVWSLDQLRQAIDDESLYETAQRYFAMNEAGNAPSGNFSVSELVGYNTPRIPNALAQLAENLEISTEEAYTRIERILDLLFKARSERPRPHLDDKIIVSWNGLAISAFSRAAQALGEPKYTQAAIQTAQFIRSRLYDSNSKRLSRLYRDRASEVAAFVDDYAYLIEGLIDLYEASADPQWLDWANQLQQTQNELFYDSAQGGYYSFQADESIVFEPSKESFDGSIPSANSVSAKNLARLAQFFDSGLYEEQARMTLLAFLPTIRESPIRMPALLDASLYVIKKPMQIVIAEPKESNAMARMASSTLLPNRLLLHANASESQAYLGQRLEFIRGATAIGGQPTAYVCENFVCQLPARSPDELAKQLQGLLE